jgi:hypothetical protein
MSEPTVYPEFVVLRDHYETAPDGSRVRVIDEARFCGVSIESLPIERDGEVHGWIVTPPEDWPPAQVNALARCWRQAEDVS